jgi:hypothetical protein
MTNVGIRDTVFVSVESERSGSLETRSTMSDQEMKAELDRLRNENAALKKGTSTGIRLRVSERGAVSVYGMGRFPVTLYDGAFSRDPV